METKKDNFKDYLKEEIWNDWLYSPIILLIIIFPLGALAALFMGEPTFAGAIMVMTGAWMLLLTGLTFRDFKYKERQDKKDEIRAKKKLDAWNKSKEKEDLSTYVTDLVVLVGLQKDYFEKESEYTDQLLLELAYKGEVLAKLNKKKNRVLLSARQGSIQVFLSEDQKAKLIKGDLSEYTNVLQDGDIEVYDKYPAFPTLISKSDNNFVLG